MDLKKAKETGILEITKEDMDDPGTIKMVQHFLNKQQDEYVKQEQEIQDTLNVSEPYALAIWYLRTRSRWTQELEDKLIQMHNDGEKCPNMNEWPPRE